MGTLNLGSGSLNLTGTLAASQVNTNILRHSDGVTQHKNVTYVSTTATILGGMTWHTSYNGASHDLGDLSAYTDSNTVAIQIMHRNGYNYSSGAAYSYLTGYFHQKGKAYTTYGVYSSMITYNQYLQYISHSMVLPWDPNGDQTLQIYVNSAYTTGANTQDVYMQGVFKQSA